MEIQSHLPLVREQDAEMDFDISAVSLQACIIACIAENTNGCGLFFKKGINPPPLTPCSVLKGVRDQWRNDQGKQQMNKPSPSLPASLNQWIPVILST